MGTRPWGSSSQNHHPGLKHPLRVGPPTPAPGAGPSPTGLLRAHQPPRALSSPHTLDNMDNFPPTFHAPGASHTQHVAKQPPQLSHWHWGTSSCPPGLGWGSGQSWPRRTAMMGARPSPMPCHPRPLGRTLGVLGLYSALCRGGQCRGTTCCCINGYRHHLGENTMTLSPCPAAPLCWFCAPVTLGALIFLVFQLNVTQEGWDIPVTGL